jgi:TRAP-type transport system periplasmic protein
LSQAHLVGPARALSVLAAAAVLCLSGASAAQTVLKFATTLPAGNPLVADFFEPWAKKVNEAAGKEFQIQVVNGPTLANAVNVWTRVSDGVADIGWGINGAVNLPFPKSTVISLPLLVEEGQLPAASVAQWRLYQSGLIADEYKGVKVLGLIGSPVQGLSSRTPITRLEEMKGLKVRAADKIVADMVTALGGSPISVPAADVYQALNQGVVSASVAGWVLIGTFRLDEVMHEHVQGIAMGAPAGFIVMNPQSYDGLSAQGKKILDQYTGEALSRPFATFFEQLAMTMRDKIKANGAHHFTTLAPDEAARWKAALQGVVNNWEKQTPNGPAILAAFKQQLGSAMQGK